MQRCSASEPVRSAAAAAGHQHVHAAGVFALGARYGDKLGDERLFVPATAAPKHSPSAEPRGGAGGTGVAASCACSPDAGCAPCPARRAALQL